MLISHTEDAHIAGTRFHPKLNKKLLARHDDFRFYTGSAFAIRALRRVPD